MTTPKLTGALMIVLSVIASSCEEGPDPSKQCATPAIVRDISGLDGCGFVFELKDGTRLVPVPLLFCGTPPLPQEITEHPLYNFEFVDGKQVIIGYAETNEFADVCMAGKTVLITCLQELNTSPTD